MTNDESVAARVFVGHVRYAVDGVPEFATGWNELDAPKDRISAVSEPGLHASRGWFDAYATPNQSEPFAIERCRCGMKIPPVKK